MPTVPIALDTRPLSRLSILLPKYSTKAHPPWRWPMALLTPKSIPQMTSRVGRRVLLAAISIQRV